MKVFGYAAQSPDDVLTPFSFERRDLRQGDIAIDILYCGVCHTDLHIARNHGGVTNYPVVPGHEIVGVVSAVGGGVTRFKVGERVGVGCMVDSCRDCRSCLRGFEQYCERGATFTYNALDRHDGRRTYGGYSDKIVVSESFVLKIADTLDLAGAAPLLCAGITTWEPLRKYGIGNASRVAVIGLGGLGHMAIKLASAMGAEVTLMTRSAAKTEHGLSLGASSVVLMGEPAELAAVAGSFDLIIDTIPYDHDINPYVPTLAVGGTLVLVGYMGSLTTPVAAGALVRGRKAIAGSFIGGVAETQAMLDFCAEHAILSAIEIIPIQQINDAYEQMANGELRHRFVIDMNSLQDARLAQS